MINIYEKNETTFTNNGLATLEPMTCDLSMTINGAWVLSVEHPYDQEGKWTELQKGRIIQVSNINVLRNCSTTQRYRIYDTTKTLTSVKVIAFPLGMEATYDAIIEELKISDKTGNQAVSAISSYLADAEMTKYTLTASGLTKKRSVNFKNTNLIAALCGDDDNSVVNKYNAEIAYNNYQIFVKDKIGSKTDYDVRLGKNLTGLTYEMDDSDVVTRLYPISQDGIRLNQFEVPSGGADHYIDSEEKKEYPHIRAAFVEVPYSLIDTDVDALVKSETALLTEQAYDAIYDYTHQYMESFWGDVCADNLFTYTHETMTEILPAVPEFIQRIISEISPNVASNILTDIVSPDLKSWLTSSIRAGMDWVKDVDLPEKNWIENQDHSYSYGNSLRKLTNEWAYIDGKMSYFDSNSKWVPEKDDPIPWDWVQKKGHAKKYGNNKRYNARDTYIYNRNDYPDGANDGMYKYWFDEDGWYDGEEEETDWCWNNDGTGDWFGDPDAAGDSSKYAHDCWLFIRETSGSPSKLYYFGSDGYLKAEESVNWNWHKEKDKWFFGTTDKTSRAIYLAEQWLYIDGDWYFFDENGYVNKLKDMQLFTTTVLSHYIGDNISSEITIQQNSLYMLLYQLMNTYCSDLYAAGLDKPLINVAIDFVDLSKTQEYAAYSSLETVYLGDDVKVTYDSIGSYVEEEVVGLVYDCLKGCNTQITVGRASKTVSQMFDTSVKGSDSGQRLVAGENVTITGNTINVSSQVGDVYAGDTVSVQQLQSTGNPIARISVNGIPTTIYAVGTDVQVNPIKQSGDKIATITVGGTAYDIYADTGLKYWVETERDIYRTGQHEGLSGDPDYYYTNTASFETWDNNNHFEIQRLNNKPCLACLSKNTKGGAATALQWFFVSIYDDDPQSEYYNATGWQYRMRANIGEYTDDWYSPVENDNEGMDWSRTPPYRRACYTEIFTYKGVEWIVNAGNICITQTGSFYTNTNNFKLLDYDYTNPAYGSMYDHLVDFAKDIIDAADGEGLIDDIFGISNDPNSDKLLWYSKNGNYEAHDDDVYITKDGVFNGTGYKIDGNDMVIIKQIGTNLNLNSSGVLSATDTTYNDFAGSTHGLVPAPASGDSGKFLKGDGSWATPQDTTYNDFAGSTHGLVPAVTTQSGKYLKDDGTWATPQGGGGGASDLDDLNDVDISSPTNGQVLTYNSTTSKWENQASGGGGGGASISALSRADYDNLSQAEKNNGTLYLVNGGGESAYAFSHTVTGTTYGYEQLSDNIYHLAEVVSLNNVVYAGFIHDFKLKTSRLMSAAELASFASQLSMTSDGNSSMTLTTTNPLTPYIFWRNGGNNDYLYMDASTNNVGIRCGYAGCKAHLFYTNVNGNQIIRNEVIYSEYMEV